MPQGIEIYRDGEFELGHVPYFSTSSGFILGSQVNGAASGSITDANLANGNPWLYVQTSAFPPNLPDFTITGTTISWGATAWSGTLYWGIR